MVTNAGGCIIVPRLAADRSSRDSQQRTQSSSLHSTAVRARSVSLRPSLTLPLRARPTAPAQRRSNVVTSASNLIVEVLLSGAAGAAAAAVATITAENRDAEIERIQTPDGAVPIVAAIAVDAIAHSVPGLSVLLPLLSEPAGAAAGVAYLMTVVLSSPAVDPSTLAPAGTLLNAEKAKDARANVRVPFTQILPTAIKVVDTTNEGSSGAGWTPGKGSLPKLPITSVLAVVGVGSLIVEAASHAPVLGLFLPRVLQVAGWLALLGAVLDRREGAATSSE
ncbi:hypothetical protein WJX72_003012 [[Myrmecia] bisecta]|uniref:Uncharacterized protein n=1 Tax=[Myrmecia] bisecta TaxID=41462 RepID=A0AAW1R629_9CHLO